LDFVEWRFLRSHDGYGSLRKARGKGLEEDPDNKIAISSRRSCWKAADFLMD
jgi:hypothetical protein